ncbi:MAG: hypothetical protein IPL55_16370 [Saprospiraceae bacterium]|jgi:hypothetical protein|nr:hypothetical protein [Saprospiraceae bacterium]MBL0023648.1 hypothetical protein [Saprospiraceae bacterium]
MKSLKLLLTVLSFAFIANFANAAVLPYSSSTEAAQIQSMLNSIDYTNYIKGDTKVNVSFFINAQNEIIVVTTNNQDLDRVLKSTLNYRKISVGELEYNKVYTVPVHIK